MKANKPGTVQATSGDNRNERSRLELRRRPVADLTERQMEDAVGGHPHNTCDPTCPPTCCPTCPATCAHTCGDPSCAGSCGASCGDTCDAGGCDPSRNPERCI